MAERSCLSKWAAQVVVLNVLILLLIGGSLYFGYKRGFLLVFGQLASLVLAVFAAFFFYPRLSQVIVGQNWAIPSVADVLAAGLIFMVVQIFTLPLLPFLMRLLPEAKPAQVVNSASGAVLNGIKSLIFITLALNILVGLPISADQKNAISSAEVPKYLLHKSSAWQAKLGENIGGQIADSLNFMTVKPKSDERVLLGYSTTAVKADPAAEAAMLRLVNEERRKRGLRELVADDRLREASRLHARDMFAKGYFAHVNLEGEDPFDRLDRLGIRYLAAGENLALAPTVNLAHSGLMNSPGHKANILHKDFGRVGIGVIDGGKYGKMWVQTFAN